jgi:outer membrane protein OmpA-like peptidoglycan-associated protein
MSIRPNGAAIRHFAGATALALLGAAVAAEQPPAASKATIPLCPGLTIVTAISQPQGDYESIKRIESTTADGIRLRYSSYMPDPNGHDNSTMAPSPWVPFLVYRTVRRADLDASTTYLQQFASQGIPETVRGTTALGISRKSFRELRDKGKTALSIYQAINPYAGLKDDGSPVLPGIEYRLAGELTRVQPAPVTVAVLVNDRMTSLPALHARGKFIYDDSEFFFLDDEANPIALKFRIGIAQSPTDPEAQKLIDLIPDLKKMMDDPASRERMAKLNRGRDVLDVVKISYKCEDPTLAPQVGGSGGGGGGSGSGAGLGAGAARLEESLAKTGRADVYSIYFAFNSDQIRDESEPTLQEIADVLRRHPDWKLAIEGHTDNIATDVYNRQLSERRAAAVKNALVSAKGVSAARLTTAGLGESRPKDTNDTVEGRARNRRVELVRIQ